MYKFHKYPFLDVLLQNWKCSMSQKNLELEIEDKKQLYGYQQGDINAIFERLDNAPSN